MIQLLLGKEKSRGQGSWSERQLMQLARGAQVIALPVMYIVESILLCSVYRELLLHCQECFNSYQNNYDGDKLYNTCTVFNCQKVGG